MLPLATAAAALGTTTSAATGVAGSSGRSGTMAAKIQSLNDTNKNTLKITTAAQQRAAELGELVITSSSARITHTYFIILQILYFL